MPSNFLHIRLHVEDQSEGRLRSLGTRRVAVRGGTPSTDLPTFRTDEAAARYYLSQAFDSDERPALRGLTAPTRPQVVPDLRLLDVKPIAPRRVFRGVDTPLAEQPMLAAATVRFEQTRHQIPVFGSLATVELDAGRELVSIDVTLADVKGVSANPALTREAALGRIAAAAAVPVSSLQPVAEPSLTFFSDAAGTWHLAWFFQRVLVSPEALGHSQGSHRGHGLGRSPRELKPRMQILVDAHDGELLLSYPAQPTVVRCEGNDEDGTQQTFFGNRNGTGFQMHDPLRSIRTFDLASGDIEGALPSVPVTSQNSSSWQPSAAVSAHVSAMRVQLFLYDVLGRDSIDDKGMELISLVNCTYAEDEPPPEWRNAVWYQGKMWYGQAKDGNGKLRSLARCLDVIAHELTHGITETTSNLVYSGQSGALNESFSDIFGVIIANWWLVGQGKDTGVKGWTWEIGKGLGGEGRDLPLRDFSDPKRTNDPDHMNAYDHTPEDFGGVHTNSNIHNKAVYNLLTATKPDSTPAMSVRDLAVLYYLTLQRLSSQASFDDVRRTLSMEAKSFFGNPAEAEAAIRHIEAAYDAVGIV